MRAGLILQISRLRELVPNAQASWSRAENFHLTLKFLGQIPVSRMDNISVAAARAVSGFSKFQVTLMETGVFPGRGAPHVLWIGVRDESRELANLHTRFEEACANQGFAREQKPFQPHLTIARLRNPQGARALAAAHKELRFEPADVAVAELLVIRSEPSSAGSKYTVISQHRLEG